MTWLLKLLGLESALNPEGLKLKPPVWRVDPIQDLRDFLRALPILFTSEAILYLEGGYPTEELLAFLESQSIEPSVQIATGTIWPKPIIFHIPMKPEVMESLTQMVDYHASPEIAIHLHVYQDERVLLEWYDAFFDVPFYLSQEIPLEKVRLFCKSLDTQYYEEIHG